MARSGIGPEAAKTGGTKIQKTLDAQIRRIGFSTEMEYPFLPYQVDIYLPEAHMAFEADGSTHRLAADGKRDLDLATHYGLVIVRYTEKEIEEGTIDDEEIINRIDDAMQDRGERIKIWLG